MKRLLVLVLALGSLLFVGNAAAQPLPQTADKNILFLYSYGYGGRGVETFNQALISTMSAAGIGIDHLFFEYLDLERNRNDPTYRARLYDLLRHKYANRRIGLLVTVQQPALDFLLHEGREFIPGAPAITVQAPLPTVAEAHGRRLVSELSHFDIKGTLERALELFPKTRRVVFVSGSSEADKLAAAEAASVAAAWAGRLSIETTSELSLKEMLARVAHLPSRSIIVFTQYNRDSQGRVTLAYEVERLITKVANAPVFGLYDFNLDDGGIGGSVISVRALGEQTGRLALDLLNGRRELTRPVTEVDSQAVPIFDWSQIKRWGGDPGRLPKNSLIVNRVPTFWGQYRGIGIGLVIFLSAQSFLIAALLMNKRRRKRVEQSLQDSERHYRVLTESASDAIVSADAAGRIVGWNTAAQRLFGYAEGEASGQSLTLLIPQRFQGVHREGMRRLLAGGSPQLIGRVVELTGRRKDGIEVPLELSLAQWETVDGRFFTAIMRDITERKRADLELRIAAAAFETHEGMMVTDAEGVIVRVNRAFTRLTGYSAEEAVGKTSALLSSGRQAPEFYRQLWETLKQDRYWGGEIWNRRKSGEIYPEWLTISAVSGPGGEITRYIGIFSDITERKAAEEQIRSLAFHDPLTQLPNRRLLLDRLGQALQASARRRNFGALLFLDLDNFKALNDTLGHETGDLLLAEVARRLLSCIRGEDTVARLGGDEFVVLLEDLGGEADAAAAKAGLIGEKIRVALGLAYTLREHVYTITSSIGSTLFQGTGETVNELLQRADMAMYQAKSAGGNTLRFFKQINTGKDQRAAGSG